MLSMQVIDQICQRSNWAPAKSAGQITFDADEDFQTERIVEAISAGKWPQEEAGYTKGNKIWSDFDRRVKRDTHTVNCGDWLLSPATDF